MRRAAAALTVLLAGCIGAAADHDVLGDRAYAAGRFHDALAEYRLALLQLPEPTPDLRAKAGAAAINAGDLAAAVEEYEALAREGGEERLSEAAAGLARVVRAAGERDDREALTAALAALQRVAPGRALVPFARQLVRLLGDGPQSAEALSVLTLAAAGAPDARAQDSLMYAYAVALRRLGRCEQAVPALESLVRREREPAVVPDAQRELVRCALGLGQRALEQGRPQAAENWFLRAVRGGAGAFGERAAYVGLGDVRLAQGDYLGAAQAFERALDGAAPGDSVAQIARERLNQLGRPPGTEFE